MKGQPVKAFFEEVRPFQLLAKIEEQLGISHHLILGQHPDFPTLLHHHLPRGLTGQHGHGHRAVKLLGHVQTLQSIHRHCILRGHTRLGPIRTHARARRTKIAVGVGIARIVSRPQSIWPFRTTNRQQFLRDGIRRLQDARSSHGYRQQTTQDAA